MEISIKLFNGDTHLVQSPFTFTLLYFNNLENHKRIILCILIFLSSTSGTCTRTFSPTLAVTNFSFDCRSILLACFLRFYLAMGRFVRYLFIFLRIISDHCYFLSLQYLHHFYQRAAPFGSAYNFLVKFTY